SALSHVVARPCPTRSSSDLLHADESPDALADGAHKRLALTQAVDRLELVHILEVIAGVQVREDRAGFVARRERDLDHILQIFSRLLVDAEVLARGAELAGAVGLRGPGEAGNGRISAPATS